MTFKEAAAFKMPLGLYQGRTLDSIGGDDDGLLYLDWLMGQEVFRSQQKVVYDALAIYCGDKAIRAEIRRVLESRPPEPPSGLRSSPYVGL